MKKFLLGIVFVCAIFSFEALFAGGCHKCGVNKLRQHFTREKFLEIEAEVDGYLEKTPLIFLPHLSALSGKEVYLKDESRQKGGSFKTRGVTYEVFTTIQDIIENDPKLLKSGVQLVTQTDGNHGIALITAIHSAVEKFSAEYPKLAKHIRKIEPVIFTYKTILSVKREAMEEAMQKYREAVRHPASGQIFDNYVDYGDARGGREKFISASGGRARYMEHGGIKTMQGHGIATLEILDQLEEYNVDQSKRICILLPVGAGGPIGLAASLKAFRPFDLAVMVQTPRYDAFIRSFENRKMEYNDSSLSPYTVEIEEDGKTKQIVYEDGIGVDGPESEEALQIALLYLDNALYANPQKALELAPLMLKDIDAYYQNEEGIVGGTTAIVAEALLFNSSDLTIQSSDVVVLFGTEGSIDPAIAKYTRKLMKEQSLP